MIEGFHLPNVPLAPEFAIDQVRRCSSDRLRNLRTRKDLGMGILVGPCGSAGSASLRSVAQTRRLGLRDWGA